MIAELTIAELEHLALRAAEIGDLELARVVDAILRLTAANERAGAVADRILDGLLDQLDTAADVLSELQRRIQDCISNDPDLAEWMERGRRRESVLLTDAVNARAKVVP